jgi:hypothetical protein
VLGIALFIPYADFFALLRSAIWIIVTGLVLAREPSERGDAAVTSAA